MKAPSRLVMIAAAVGGFWVVLLGRATHLALGPTDLASAAVRQRVRSIALPPTPGRIVDRRGRVLAISREVPSVYVDPSAIDDAPGFAAVAGPILGRSADRIEADLTEHRDSRFRWLQRQVCESNVAALADAGLPQDSWGVRLEWQRLYPQGPLASHLIGFRDRDHNGRDGIERRLAEELRGSPGQKTYVQDARGRRLQQLSDLRTVTTDGSTIRLTIDAAVQSLAATELHRLAEEFHPAWASVVLVDVASQSVLAVENIPTFDPNEPIGALTAGVDHASRSRVEPGSTFKPFLVGRTLEAELTELGEAIDAHWGHLERDGRIVRDSHPVESVTPAELLVQSSNIGAVDLAERLGVRQTHRLLDELGVAVRPRVDLPGRPGQLRPVEDWSGFSLASHALGYEWTVTPLHLAVAYTALAGDGRLPSLAVRHDVPQVAAPPQAILDPATCRWLRTGPLREVVSRGTAAGADRDAITGPPIFGKTGTAQKYDATEGRYRSDRTVCLFAGGIPCERPALVAVVVVDDPTTGRGRGGGSVAAPAACRLLRQTWRLTQSTQITDGATAASAAKESVIPSYR